MKKTTAQAAAAQVSPELAEAALKGAEKPATGLGWPFDDLAWERPLTWAEANASTPAARVADRDAQRMRDEVTGREAREARELAEGSWAQPGTEAALDAGYDGEHVRVTRRYAEQDAKGRWNQMATVEMADGSDFGEWDELDVDVRELRPWRG